MNRLHLWPWNRSLSDPPLPPPQQQQQRWTYIINTRSFLRTQICKVCGKPFTPTTGILLMPTTICLLQRFLVWSNILTIYWSFLRQILLELLDLLMLANFASADWCHWSGITYRANVIDSGSEKKHWKNKKMMDWWWARAELERTKTKPGLGKIVAPRLNATTSVT